MRKALSLGITLVWLVSCSGDPSSGLGSGELAEGDSGAEDDVGLRIFLDGTTGAKLDAAKRGADGGSGSGGATAIPPLIDGSEIPTADAREDAALLEADAGAETTGARSCNQVHACMRAGKSLGVCGAGTSAESRAEAATLQTCEEGLCWQACGGSPPETCDGCLARSCALAWETCTEGRAPPVVEPPADARADVETSEAAVVDTTTCDAATDAGDAEGGAREGAPADAEADSPSASCGDGVVQENEGCDDGNSDPFDRCSSRCEPAAEHLLITEVVTRPNGAEMIEIFNPTRAVVDLSDYAISDNHLYYRVAVGSFTTSSGSDFAARFPEGSLITPGAYRTIAIANADGGSTGFRAVYGKKPDFELRPSANGATDDPEVPNMRSVTESQTIGATATLTDAGEPIVLFFYADGDRVYDVDYVDYGTPSASNPPVDKTGVIVGSASYDSDTAAALQSLVPAPGDGGSIHRCSYAEPGETSSRGNGLTGHDVTAERLRDAFAVNAGTPERRTPGGPPPAGMCPP